MSVAVEVVPEPFGVTSTFRVPEEEMLTVQAPVTETLTSVVSLLQMSPEGVRLFVQSTAEDVPAGVSRLEEIKASKTLRKR